MNLARLLDNLPVRHVFLALDVCFGGMFDPRIAQESGATRAAGPSSEVSDDEYIEDVLKIRTRKVLTSGRDNPVPDGPLGGHSPFAERLIDALSNANQGEKIVDFFDLRNAVKMLKSRPADCDFGSSGPGSDFVFVRTTSIGSGRTAKGQ